MPFHLRIILGILLFAALPLAALLWNPPDYAANWEWSAEKSSPQYCAKNQAGSYTVDIQTSPGKYGVFSLQIAFGKPGQPTFTIDGHGRTVFFVADDTLWYADYPITTTGGRVVAIDLKTGGQHWSTALEAANPASFSHSRYDNSMCMSRTPTGNIRISGREDYGCFYEDLDPKTGAQRAHKIIARPK